MTAGLAVPQVVLQYSSGFFLLSTGQQLLPRTFLTADFYIQSRLKIEFYFFHQNT